MRFPNAALVALAALALPACGDKPGHAYVWAGTGTPGFDGDGKAITESRLYNPIDLAFAPDGTPWVLDWNNHKIRVVTKDGTFKTVVGHFIGDGDDDGLERTPEGAPGDTVAVNHPTDLDFAPDGTVFVASWHNHKVRTVDAGGRVRVLCGSDPGFKGDGSGSLDGVKLKWPKAIARAPDGGFYLLDQGNQRIRKLTLGASPSIATVAGTGTVGTEGDGGEPLSAQFHFDTDDTTPKPSGALAVGPDGALYVSDALNYRIRKIDFARQVITTIAGTGEAGDGGDGGPALQAKVNDVRDLEFGPDGRLYLADTNNHRIRAIDLAAGVITTVAGTGSAGKGEEGQEATKTALHDPYGIAFDKDGALYIADTYNDRILRVPR